MSDNVVAGVVQQPAYFARGVIVINNHRMWNSAGALKLFSTRITTTFRPRQQFPQPVGRDLVETCRVFQASYTTRHRRISTTWAEASCAAFALSIAMKRLRLFTSPLGACGTSQFAMSCAVLEVSFGLIDAAVRYASRHLA
jgi:hypothetical protein